MPDPDRYAIVGSRRSRRLDAIDDDPTRDQQLRAASVVRRMIPDPAERRGVLEMLGLVPNRAERPGAPEPVTATQPHHPDPDRGSTTATAPA